MTKWKGRVASVAPSLASVSVVALVASGAMATAAEINVVSTVYHDIGPSEDLTITDHGGILVDSGATYAVQLSHPYIGTVENSGSIHISRVDANVAGDADGTTAVGILVVGNLGNNTVGGFINNAEGGSITVDLTHQTDINGEDPSYMYAYGIYGQDVLRGDSQITNAGTVTVSADGSNSQEVVAGGIVSDGSPDNAVVSNSGTILVDAEGTAAKVSSRGIQEGTSSVSHTYTNGHDYLYFYGTTEGDITNSGEITASATVYGLNAGPDSFAYATGIYTPTLTYGSIDNTSTGSLTVTATIHGADDTDGYALGHGIWIQGGVDGAATINSSGSIDVTAIGTGGADASAYGIEVGDLTTYYDNRETFGSLDGTLTISGDVTATALVGTPDRDGGVAVADGVMTLYTPYGSVIETTQTGTITAIASADGGANAWSDGLFFGVADGTMTLDGDITASATASHTDTVSGGSALADGVLTIARGPGSDFETSGTIHVTADALDGGVAHADGVLTMFDVGGNGDYNDIVQNPSAFAGSLNENLLSGVITVEASGASALAVGTLSYLSLGTLTTNSGTINATATTTDIGSNEPLGLLSNLFNDEIFNDIFNDTFLGGVLGGDTGLNGAVGMGSYVNLFSAIVNTGEINVDFSVNATADTTGLYGAAGIGVFWNVGGMVANTGTINATATDADAAGIAVAGNSGLVLNSGTINADASGDYGQAIGVFVDGTSYAMFINTGTIIASNNGDTHGIAVYAQTHTNGGDDESQVVLATGGFIEGEIIASGETVGANDGLTHLDVLGTAGSSINWTVYGEDDNIWDSLYTANTLLGTTVFKAQIDDMVWQFTTIDSSQFAAQRESMLDASDQSASVQASQTEAALASGKFNAYGIATRSTMTYSGTGASPITVDPIGFYAGLFGGGGLNDFNAFSNISGGTLDREVTTSTLSAGGTLKTDGGLAVGVGIGGQSGDATMSSFYMTSSETSSNGAYAGVSVAGQSKNFSFGGGLTAGMFSNSYDRWENNNLVVGGIDQASGDYNSSYLTAQAGAAGHFKLGFGVTVSPGVTLRYTKGQIDAYSETGDNTAALASVAEQSFGILERQFDLNVAKDLGMGSLNANLSVTRRGLSTSDSVDVTMLGDQENVSGFTADTTTKTLSVGFSASLATGLSLNIEAARPIGSDDVSGTTVGGGLRLAF